MSDRPLARGLGERIAITVEQLGGAVPVDLETLARDLGVREIRTTRMTEDGRTTWTDGQPLIELRPDRPAERRRFTLAHEIGHILISQDRTIVRRTAGANLAADDIEVLCDWIAASILMPRAWIEPYAFRERYSLSLLRRVAHAAGVSMSAAAVRVAEVGGRTCALLRWKRTDARWVVVGQAAMPPRYAGSIEATSETAQFLDGLPHRRDTWCELSITAGGISLGGVAHADRSRDTCMTLLTTLDAPGSGA